MKYYTSTTEYNCGIDLHARQMYVCVMDRQGKKLVHTNIRNNDFDYFLKLVAPYKHDLTVCCECMFGWYWLADACQAAGLTFVLAHALYVKAIHGGKNKNDRIDSEKLIHLLRSNLIPPSYIYPADKRPLRALLRQRLFYVWRRSELLARIYSHQLAQNRVPPKQTRRVRDPWEEQVLKAEDHPLRQIALKNDLAMIKHFDHQIFQLDEATLRQQIAEQVRTLAPHQEIVWWALTPEELRPWRVEEMTYLRLVCEEIRKADPLHRPIYHYNPNHRTASTLGPIAQQVDVLAKGCYVNFVGRKRDRAWVRWSIEQEVQALQAAGRPSALALLVPELCQDPEPEEDAEIRAWVRHDLYLGLACGAKGVLIWSLWPRPEVVRTWPLWYNAYAECARELNGPRALASVFLFGQRRADLKITQVKGQSAAQVGLGGNVESTTTSSDERAQRRIKLPSYTTAELAWGSSRWLFVINSANAPALFSVSGYPKGSRARNAFTEQPVSLPDTTPLTFELPAYGVTALRFSSATESGSASVASRR